mgnify:CR=1 FL=1
MQQQSGVPLAMPSGAPPQHFAAAQALAGPPSTLQSRPGSVSKSVSGQQQPPSVVSAPAAGWQGGAGNTVDTQGRRDTGLSGGPLSVWSANESFRQGSVPVAWQGMPGWGGGGGGQPMHAFGNGSTHGGSVHGSVHSMPFHMMHAGNWQGLYAGPMMGQAPPHGQWQQGPFPPSMPHMGQMGNGAPPSGAPSVPMAASMGGAMQQQQQAAAVAAAAAVGGVRRMQPSQGAGMPTQGAAKRARASDT